jgi:hypothetical protein
MAYTNGLVQIESLITKALYRAKKGEDDFHFFLQLGFDGIRELNAKALDSSIVWTKVTPDNLNRIDYPQDLERFIGIGVPYGGKIVFLTRRNDIIATYTDDGDGTYSLDATDGEGVDLPRAQWEGMHAEGGVNIHGYFSLDDKAREILINSVTRSELILVYSTSGIYTDQIQYVPTIASEALIAWILWKDAEGDARNNAQAAFAEWRKQRYVEERQELKRLGFSVREFWDVLNDTKSLFRA